VKFSKYFGKRRKKKVLIKILEAVLCIYCPAFPAQAFAPVPKNISNTDHLEAAYRKGKPPFLFPYFLYDITQEAFKTAHIN
jgi:hypothetical protein